jgi:hypothetical protein
VNSGKPVWNRCDAPIILQPSRLASSDRLHGARRVVQRAEPIEGSLGLVVLYVAVRPIQAGIRQVWL